ncbi:restriction endonuclease subunit S [Bacillus paramobilis]|uniref:restriction endonuclease subunit S n=1 Tax=Bacillus paramobilis TaxID=2817477 RepID=UPI003D1DA4F7
MVSKKKTKTLDELLEEALVPEVEKPYELPEGWIWVNNDSVMTFVGGGTPSKSNLAYWNGDIPWATVKDIKGKYLNDTMDSITKEGLENSSANVAYPNELLLITRMSPGKTIITNIETAINQDLKIVRPKLSVLPEYMWLYFENNRGIIEHDSTGTTVKGIQVDRLKKYLFPLPPLHEQKRIVEKVERLLNKVEEAQQLIEEAKETFELRQAAIIRTILQEGLNEDNIPDGWKFTKIKDLFNIFGGGTPSKAKEEYWNGSIPWISAKDMKTTYISDTLDYITEGGLKNSSAKLTRRGSVVMVVRSGILQRTLPVAYLLTDCTVNQDLKIFDSGNELINKYFMWYVKGNEKSLLHNYSKSGTTVNSIEFEKFKSHEIILPPMDILKRKIDKVEKVIEKEKSTNVILNIAETIEELKSSILSRAVQGKLGTNDSGEENAIELLKEILQERVK